MALHVGSIMNGYHNDVCYLSIMTASICLWFGNLLNVYRRLWFSIHNTMVYWETRKFCCIFWMLPYHACIWVAYLVCQIRHLTLLAKLSSCQKRTPQWCVVFLGNDYHDVFIATKLWKVWSALFVIQNERFYKTWVVLVKFDSCTTRREYRVNKTNI